MAYTPIINWTNMTDFSELPSLANTATNGTFWVGILHMLFIVILLVLLSYGFEVAIIISSFLGLILAILMVYSGVISWAYIVEFAGILLFMFLYIIWSTSSKNAYSR